MKQIGSTNPEQIRNALEILRLSDQVKLSAMQHEKIAHISKATLDAILGL